MGLPSIPAIAQAMYGIYRTQTIHCISVFNGINFALKRSRFLNYASFQTSVRNIPNNTSAIAREASQKHLLYRLTLIYFLTFTLVGNLAHLPEKPSVGGEVSKS